MEESCDFQGYYWWWWVFFFFFVSLFLHHLYCQNRIVLYISIRGEIELEKPCLKESRVRLDAIVDLLHQGVFFLCRTTTFVAHCSSVLLCSLFPLSMRVSFFNELLLFSCVPLIVHLSVTFFCDSFSYFLCSYLDLLSSHKNHL